MNIVLKRIFKIISSAFAVILVVAICGEVCNHPSVEVENTVSSFYREPDGTLDAVFVGSSAANKDFLPPVIWKQSGITSYCLAVGACSANIYKSVMTEVVTKQKDAVMLIDADGFLVDDKFQNEIDPIRLWLDSMPKNENWFRTVRELDRENALEHYFPLIRYHRNMTTLFATLPIAVSLLSKQLKNETDPMKGATLNSGNHGITGLIDSTNAGDNQLTEKAKQILFDFIAYCKSESINKIVFVNLPKSYYDESSKKRNLIMCARFTDLAEFVQSQGCEVFDYNALGNPAKLSGDDFADSLHLNTEGAVKFSAYFAHYLAESNRFSEKSDSVVQQWNSDYEAAVFANEIIAH